MAEVNPSRMAQLRTSCPDFPADVSSGIVVTRVTAGSPAAAAGFKEDDVIVGIHAPGMTAATAAAAESSGTAGGVGLTVSGLADALKAAIGGSLELVIVREQQVSRQSSGSGNGSSSSSRYAYINLTVKPIEAPHSSAGCCTG